MHHWHREHKFAFVCCSDFLNPPIPVAIYVKRIEKALPILSRARVCVRMCVNGATCSELKYLVLFLVYRVCVDMFNVKYYIKSESSFCTLFALSQEAVGAVFICIYLLSLPLESPCNSNNSKNFMNFFNIMLMLSIEWHMCKLFIVKISLNMMKSRFQLLLAYGDITLSPLFCPFLSVQYKYLNSEMLCVENI